MKKHLRKRLGNVVIISGIAASSAFAARAAFAVCVQTANNVAVSDQSLFVLRDCFINRRNPDPNYYPNWHHANMHIDPNDWVGRFTPCDIKSDYAKEVNASWLVAALPHLPPDPPGVPGNCGLTAGSINLSKRAFHGHDDYGPVIDGNDTDWHDELKHRIIDGYGQPPGVTLGTMEFNNVSINELQTFCTVYDWNEPFV